MLVKATKIKEDTQSCSRQEQNQNQQKTALLNKNQCFGCGQNHHQDKSECSAFGKTCHKCGRSNHFVSVCGKIPYRRSSFRSKSQGRQTLVNELNQNNHDSGATLMSISRNTEYGNVMNTVPKQVLDVVNLANKGNSSKTFQHHLELDTLSTSACPTAAVAQPMQVFSNIEIDGVLIHGKQDTSAEINIMPLNVYDQLNQKLHYNLELKPCGDIKVKPKQNKVKPLCKAHIMELYPDLFEGVGTIDGAEVKLDVDPSVPPVVQPQRKIPQAMIEPLKKEID